jgi:hypothetical protein
MSRIQMATLVWEEEYGEGSVELVGRFTEETTISQLDALQDWIDALTNLYSETLENFETKH